MSGSLATSATDPGCYANLDSTLTVAALTATDRFAAHRLHGPVQHDDRHSILGRRPQVGHDAPAILGGVGAPLHLVNNLVRPRTQLLDEGTIFREALFFLLAGRHRALGEERAQFAQV